MTLPPPPLIFNVSKKNSRAHLHLPLDSPFIHPLAAPQLDLIPTILSLSNKKHSQNVFRSKNSHHRRLRTCRLVSSFDARGKRNSRHASRALPQTRRE